MAFNFGDAGSTNPSSRRTKIGETILETGVWYHILGVVKSATDMDIFINGINDCGRYSGTGGEITYSTLPGSIGRKDSNPSLPPRYFHGYIDEFYYWKREVGIEEIINIEPPSLPTNFISFEVPGQIGIALIDTLNHIIEVNVECSSSLELVATFNLSKDAKAFIKNVQQFSGFSLNNFNTEKIYTITNSFRCTQFQSDWAVRVTKQTTSSSETDTFTSFSSIEIQNQIGLAQVNLFQNTISFEVTCDADISNLYINYSIKKIQ